MKGKVTWKSAGLSAKRWRAASQARGPANLLPQPKAPDLRARTTRTGAQRPYRKG